MPAPSPSQVRRLLVSTDGEVIGDGIIRLAFAAGLKRANPHLHVTWMSAQTSVYANALAEMAAPLIDRLIVLPDRTLRGDEFLRGPRALRGLAFDAAIDTQRNLKRSFWLKRANSARFISAAGDGLLSNQRPLPLLDPHFLTRLCTLGSVAIGATVTPLTPPLPPGNWQAVAARLLPPAQRYVGLIVGAGHPDKCWPLPQFLALAETVVALDAVPVFLLGPGEADLRPQLSAAVGQAVFPLQEIARPTPYHTIALGERLAAAVANDSGGGHLLAAADAPLVSLFRSASVRAKFRPASRRLIALAPEDFSGSRVADIPFHAVSEGLALLLAGRTTSP